MFAQFCYNTLIKNTVELGFNGIEGTNKTDASMNNKKAHFINIKDTLVQELNLKTILGK